MSAVHSNQQESPRPEALQQSVSFDQFMGKPRVRRSSSVDSYTGANPFADSDNDSDDAAGPDLSPVVSPRRPSAASSDSGDEPEAFSDSDEEAPAGPTAPVPAPLKVSATPRAKPTELQRLQAENAALQQAQRSALAQRRMMQHELFALRHEIKHRPATDLEAARQAERERAAAQLADAEAHWERERARLVEEHGAELRATTEKLNAALDEVRTCRSSLAIHVQGQADAVEELVRVRQEQYADRQSAAGMHSDRADILESHREAVHAVREEFKGVVEAQQAAVDRLTRELQAAREEGAQLRRRPGRSEDELMERIAEAETEVEERLAQRAREAEEEEEEEAEPPAPAPVQPQYPRGDRRRKSVIMLSAIETEHFHSDLAASPAAHGGGGGGRGGHHGHGETLLAQIGGELAAAESPLAASPSEIEAAVRRNLEAELGRRALQS